MEKVIEYRTNKSGIGFLAEVKESEEQTDLGVIFEKVEPEDLIKYGLIPEFVGRLPIVTTLTDLDEDALIKILQEPKNALIKQYQTLFNMENVKLILSKDALNVIAKKAIVRKTGARGLRSIIEALLLKTMFKLPTMENVKEVVIDQSVVKNKSEPLIIYSKSKKISAA